MDVVFPLGDERALFVQIAFAAHVAVTWDEDVLVQSSQRLQCHQPQVWVSLVQPGMDAVEDVVAGEDHALLFDNHRRLIEGVAGHVNHLEGVVADVHGHGVAEGDHWKIGSVIFQQRRLVRPECADSGGMLGHVSVQHAGADPFVGDDGGVEEGVAGPMVAVGLGIDDVAEQSSLPDLRLQPYRRGGLVGAVNHDDAVGGGHESKVATSSLGFNPNIAGYLFHADSPCWVACVPSDSSTTAGSFMVKVDPLPNSLSTNAVPPSNKRMKASDAPISRTDPLTIRSNTSSVLWAAATLLETPSSAIERSRSRRRSSSSYFFVFRWSFMCYLPKKLPVL